MTERPSPRAVPSPSHPRSPQPPARLSAAAGSELRALPSRCRLRDAPPRALELQQGRRQRGQPRLAPPPRSPPYLQGPNSAVSPGDGGGWGGGIGQDDGRARYAHGALRDAVALPRLSSRPVSRQGRRALGDSRGRSRRPLTQRQAATGSRVNSRKPWPACSERTHRQKP